MRYLKSMSKFAQLSAQLNAPQWDAVRSADGPLLILAGAGSGKTRVITYRIAHLIVSGLATPGQILAVTFTNKAAREMENRVHSLLKELGIPLFDPMWISTFHSTCARLLRDHIEMLDYRPFFSIYDDSDQLSQIKKVMQKLNINDKVYPAKSFRGRINDAKMLALHPDEVENKAPYLMDELSIKVYQEYENEMKAANALDFGDLLFKTYDLFRTYPGLVEEYQDKFKYIMVDEYQDTNHIQYLLVQMLAKKHQNLCVVGDEDQSIYSWRGADISNILEFERDFSDCKTVKLEENYRSSQTIVEAATAVIQNNTQRKNKTLFTNNNPGSKIIVREEKTDFDEARYVVQKIERLMSETQLSRKEVAIFYRTNAQSRVLEDQLRSHGFPYRIVGGTKFYDRMEVKDILAYMKLVLNPTDDIACQRIINVPARGIGKTSINKIVEISAEQGNSFYDAAVYAAEQRLIHSGASKKIQGFRYMMERICDGANELRPSEVFHRILDETGYVQRLKEEHTSEADARVENLEELDNAIQQFQAERGEEATLQNFLEEIALISDIDNMSDADDTITLMTLHISKGLEYPTVFIVGLEEGLFPTVRALDDSSGDPTALEEERRLAYVGMTRAMKDLYLTYARQRRVWGQEQNHPPSRFLKEIPDKYVTFESAISRPSFFEKHSSSSQYEASNYDGNTRGRAGSGNYGSKYSGADTSSFRDFDDIPRYEDFTDDLAAQGYRKGMRVSHPTFGAGSIYQVEGTGEQQKVSVMFDSKMMKKFVVKYARLEVL